MNYTLHQLKIFWTVSQTLSITKAAEELHLTQPAVSIQLKNFQDQFDFPLIEQLNKRLFLTDFGQQIAASAEKILQEVQDINFKMHAQNDQLVGKLKIAVVSTGIYVAPYFLADFLQQNQGVQLTMEVTNKAQVLASMEMNEVDFALVSVLPDRLNVSYLELIPNKLFLVGNNDRRFGKKIYDKKIFEDLQLIYRERGSGTRLVMEKFILENKLPVKKKMELTSNEAVKQAVIAGLGYSIMPIIGIKNELEQKHLQIIPIKGFPIQSKWYLIWLSGKKLAPVASALHQFLERNKEQVVREKFSWYEQY